MKKAKKKIKAGEARMLQNLFRTPRSLTVNEISSKSNIAWKTADTYIKKWETKGLVQKSPMSIVSQKKKRKIFIPKWTISQSLLGKIIKRKK